MHRNTKECAWHFILPSLGKVDRGDFGQNVNPYWSNSKLTDNLLFRERYCRDSIMLNGGAEFLDESSSPVKYEVFGSMP